MKSSAPAILWALSAAMFGIGLLRLFSHRAYVRSTLRVRGRTLQPQVDRSEGTDYTTVAEYEVKGRRYVINEGGTSNIRWFHRAGREVWVHFRPDEPAKGRLVSWWEGWLFLIPFFLALYIAGVALFGTQFPPAAK